MLTTLQIRNFVTVESLELDFAEGMTTLTGETGAGKSILIDALGLVLGDKADTSLIRAGCDKAEISAQFTLSRQSIIDWLEEKELNGDEDSCSVRRVLTANGRSKAFINGSLTTLALLSELGEQLIDIHGQHAHHSLSQRSHQRELLDGYAGHGELCSEVESCWMRWLQTKEELEQLSAARKEHQDQQALIEFQLAELEKLAPVDGEWQELEQQQRRLANAQTLISQSESIVEILYGDDGAESLLQKTSSELESLCEMDNSLAEGLGSVRSALIEIQEASSVLKGYSSAVELDPQQLAEVDERLGNYHSLARKYQCEPEQLTQLHQELADRLASLAGADETLELLERRLEETAADWQQAAIRLTQSRVKAAQKLEKAVTRQIQHLSMPQGQFKTELKQLAGENPLQHGSESVEFHVSANPGMPPQPLTKVASGGELSRISLAIQVVTAGLTDVETLIFDEVDVGIGGGTAEVVGQMLRELADKRQILCVTHLAQVASQAHHHLRVEKLSGDQVTHSVVVSLDEKQRVEEIARMLGGVEITKTTLDHASEMLERVSASS